MTEPTERYLQKRLSEVKEKPIGIAKFKEPVFKLGKFQNQYIEVQVQVYPLTVVDTKTKKQLIGVRFGQMDVIRFIDRSLLYDFQ